MLILQSSGQLGRKLREWGVYKYDSKNRPLNLELPPSGHRNGDGSFEEVVSYTFSEALPVPEDTAIYFTAVPDPPTAQLGPISCLTDFVPYKTSYLDSTTQGWCSLGDPLGSGEVISEYGGGTLEDTRISEPSGAAS